MKQKIINWIEPEILSAKIIANYQETLDFAFLLSGIKSNNSNSKSYLALFPQKEIFGNKINDIEKTITQNHDWWIGYFAFESAQDIGNIKFSNNYFIKNPNILWIKFSLILEFNHLEKSIIIHYSEQSQLDFIDNCKKSSIEPEKDDEYFASSCNSNFSDEEYLTAINKIKTEISNGDYYQTNLTRKFYGKINCEINKYKAWQIFSDLCKASPSNYSALIKNRYSYIISASPELFLSINNQKIISKPIKGTSPRDHLDKKKDIQNRDYLINSTKEKSENLMIVDLVRNDLSRISKIGSVKVDRLFQVDSYQTIHHLSSEISGIMLEECNIFNAIIACFPPGSMTGAPKIKAIEASNSFEKIARGIYSGTIGIIKSKDEAVFSVVIRTLILQNNNFEFQVGGAITFDSEPQKELEETYHKAKAINKVLKINLKNN